MIISETSSKIDANKKAWSLLAQEHYETYKKRLSEEDNLLNEVILQELGTVENKKILHLQCNTGADSISLARMGGIVTGVDLVPDNITYAKKLAQDFDIKNINFIESDIMEFLGKDDQKYDIVFTTEGAIKWLPDLNKWANIIKYYLKPHGFLYMMDHHPFYLLFNQQMLNNNNLSIEHPYFSEAPGKYPSIGGYAAEKQNSENYYWIHKISDVINALTRAGFSIDHFNEFDKLFYKIGDMEKVEKGFYRYPFLENKLPFTFSLKATLVH